MSRRYVFAATAGLLILAGSGAAALYISRKPHIQTYPPSIKNVVAHTTAHPSEAPVVKAAYVSTAGPEEPKYISLPTIGAQGFIQKMGIDQNNQVAAPNNVNLAGWYVNSVLPGQQGLSIIDGHVDGLSSPGIFKNLNKLKVADQFTVERGDGTVLTYRVRYINSVNAEDAVKTLFSQEPTVVSELNIITCGGTFNRTSKSYEQRIVVTAELISV
jgi:LPXTG-site transpeptidase (sortase) family protein